MCARVFSRECAKSKIKCIYFQWISQTVSHIGINDSLPNSSKFKQFKRFLFSKDWQSFFMESNGYSLVKNSENIFISEVEWCDTAPVHYTTSLLHNRKLRNQQINLTVCGRSSFSASVPCVSSQDGQVSPSGARSSIINVVLSLYVSSGSAWWICRRCLSPLKS